MHATTADAVLVGPVELGNEAFSGACTKLYDRPMAIAGSAEFRDAAAAKVVRPLAAPLCKPKWRGAARYVADPARSPLLSFIARAQGIFGVAGVGLDHVHVVRLHVHVVRLKKKAGLKHVHVVRLKRL